MRNKLRVQGQRVLNFTTFVATQCTFFSFLKSLWYRLIWHSYSFSLSSPMYWNVRWTIVEWPEYKNRGLLLFTGNVFEKIQFFSLREILAEKKARLLDPSSSSSNFVHFCHKFTLLSRISKTTLLSCFRYFLPTVQKQPLLWCKELLLYFIILEFHRHSWH